MFGERRGKVMIYSRFQIVVVDQILQDVHHFNGVIEIMLLSGALLLPRFAGEVVRQEELGYIMELMNNLSPQP